MRKLINPIKYKLRDTRIKEKFLFFPKTIKNKDDEYEMRWLEHAKWEEELYEINTCYKKIEYRCKPTNWIN